MKIVHIESGLGNQMLDYAEYLVIKKNHSNENCYIETIIYDIPECNEVICQWNGYELERIFGINAPNIKSIFNDEQWGRIMDKVRKSNFWEKGWRQYSAVICSAFNDEGYSIRYTRECPSKKTIKMQSVKKYLNCRVGYFIKRKLRPFYMETNIRKKSTKDKMFIKTEEDLYTGHFLGLSHKDSGIEFVEEEIKKAFVFPDLQDVKDINLLQEIKSSNSVAIHARRGDAISYLKYLYNYGYFKRAVKYIKKKIQNPCFYIFSDPGSIKWCKENIHTFGLNTERDYIKYIDWHVGTESYRDMQLMSNCKHNIITFSSFGWWASYLNDNPDKITISPNEWLNTTVTL